MNKMFALFVSMLALSVSCAGCHGADGNSAIAANPKLAGQSAGYLLKQLQEFKSKKRDNGTMYGMVIGLSDQNMTDLAAYYASQTAKPATGDKTLLEKGKEIYRAGLASKGVSACIGCHGPTGAGNPAAKFPALAGQHADYTVSQLTAFGKGTRNNDAGSMMQNIAAKMSEADMKAVASYIQGLQQ